MKFKENKYQDKLGNPIKVKFSLGGFNNDVTVCHLYRRRQATMFHLLFNIKPSWKNVYDGVTTDDLTIVSNYSDTDWDKLALKCIGTFNNMTVSGEKARQVIAAVNQI